MVKNIFFLLLLHYATYISAHSWHGDTGKFIITEKSLRLNDQAAGTAYLSTESDVIESAVWEFDCHTDFKPSSANYVKIYLVSDNPDLNASLNGYFLRIGSTDNDICFFRQEGIRTEKLITGKKGRIDALSNIIRMRVTRDDGGNWEVYTNTEGSYESEGRITDTGIKKTAFWGISCTYTKTRSQGFYFDHISITGLPYRDKEKPVITSCIAGQEVIQLDFSEEIKPVNAPFERFFSLNTVIPAGVVRNGEPGKLRLLFPDGFECGTAYRLDVSGLSDQAGNIMNDTAICFTLTCQPDRHDIVINEIMANPSPSVRLPEFEYIELYNRSGKNIELEGWTFTYGNTTRKFPAYLLSAKSYLLLVHPAAVLQMSDFGNTLPVLGSQSAISNPGQYLLLQDVSGNVISWSDFTSDWHDPLKMNGGWSLELVDPDQACNPRINWKSSVDGKGGTPGSRNSVAGSIEDNELPKVIRLAIPDDKTIQIHVSKPLNDIRPVNLGIDPDVPVKDIAIAGKAFDRIRISLDASLEAGQWYNLEIKDPVTDCSGYYIDFPLFRFSLPLYPENRDIVVNEILFHPLNNGFTFIELYNRSEKTIRISDLYIALKDKGGKMAAPVVISDEPMLFLPGQYLVISRKPDIVIQQYAALEYEHAFLGLLNMPSLSKESGTIVVLNKSLEVIDEVYYDSKHHSGFLLNKEGVSLEKIHPDMNTTDSWYTASQASGFGTPGQRNSQYIEPDLKTPDIVIVPEVFSPDNDGVDDLLRINYNFNMPSLMGEVMIFDSSGRKIKHLMHNNLLDTNGIIIWDGSNESGQKALTGIYIIYICIHNLLGYTRTYKLPCVLAGKSN